MRFSRSRGSVQQDGRLCSCRPEGFGERGGEGGQDRDGLVDVPVGGCGPDAQPGDELGAGVAVAQVGEGEQGLPASAEAPPPRKLGTFVDLEA